MPSQLHSPWSTRSDETTEATRTFFAGRFQGWVQMIMDGRPCAPSERAWRVSRRRLCLLPRRCFGRRIREHLERFFLPHLFAWDWHRVFPKQASEADVLAGVL